MGGDVHNILMSPSFIMPLLAMISMIIFDVHPRSTLPDLTVNTEARWPPANKVCLKAVSGFRPIVFRYALGIKCPDADAGSTKQRVKLLERAFTSAILFMPLCAAVIILLLYIDGFPSAPNTMMGEIAVFFFAIMYEKGLRSAICTFFAFSASITAV